MNPVTLVLLQALHRDALVRGSIYLEHELGVAVPHGWPVLPGGLATTAGPESAPWCGYLFVAAPSSCLIGSGGFKAPPDAVGRVEIEFEIAPAFRNLGFGTMAVRSLLGIAFASSATASVHAYTLPISSPSSRVLHKVGMRRMNSPDEARFGGLWHWKLPRPDP